MSSSSNAASKTAWASPSADAERRVSETNDTSLATDVTDLNLMVRGTGTGGQVSSVCSQVEAPRTVDQLNLKLGGGVQANSAISPASIKQRLGSYREYLWKQCLNCANRIGQWRPGGQKKGRRKSQCSTGEIGDEPAQQYWGPLIGTVFQRMIIPFGNSTLFLGDNNKKNVSYDKKAQSKSHA